MRATGRAHARGPAATRPRRSRPRRVYSVAVAQLHLEAMARGEVDPARPHPRPRELVIAVHHACRAIGQEVRERWAAEGQRVLAQFVADHPELGGAA